MGLIQTIYEITASHIAYKSDIPCMPLDIKPLTPDTPKSDEAIQRELLYTRAEAVQLIRSGQQVFGTHGASLTWGIDGEMSDDITAGQEGEKQVGNLLDAYAEKNPRVKVFHSVEWPGSKGDTDHIIICGKLVLIIDAKRWKSKRKYSVTPQGSILRGTVPFPEGKVKMMPALAAWRKELGKGVKVMGVVCIAQTEVFVPYDQNWLKAPYRLVTAEKMEEYLDRLLLASKPAKEPISPEILLQLAQKTIKARNRRAELIKMHLMGS